LAEFPSVRVSYMKSGLFERYLGSTYADDLLLADLPEHVSIPLLQLSALGIYKSRRSAGAFSDVSTPAWLDLRRQARASQQVARKYAVFVQHIEVTAHLDLSLSSSMNEAESVVVSPP